MVSQPLASGQRADASGLCLDGKVFDHHPWLFRGLWVFAATLSFEAVSLLPWATRPDKHPERDAMGSIATGSEERPADDRSALTCGEASDDAELAHWLRAKREGVNSGGRPRLPSLSDTISESLEVVAPGASPVGGGFGMLPTRGLAALSVALLVLENVSGLVLQVMYCFATGDGPGSRRSDECFANPLTVLCLASGAVCLVLAAFTER